MSKRERTIISLLAIVLLILFVFFIFRYSNQQSGHLTDGVRDVLDRPEGYYETLVSSTLTAQATP